MNDEVIYEDENNEVGNITIVRSTATGMLAWLVKKNVVKSAKQAEQLLLILAIAAVILTFAIPWLLSGSHSKVPQAQLDAYIRAMNIRAMNAR
jgi:hypothetical protein